MSRCQFTGLAALVLALNEAPTPWPFNSATFILVMVAGLVLLAGFTLLERRLRDPLIDLTLFLRRNVTGAVVVLFVLNFALGAVLFFLPLYLEEQLGFGALKAGLLLLPLSATLMIAMPLGGRLFERLGPVPPIVAGSALSGIAMLLLEPRVDLERLRRAVAVAGAARVRNRHRAHAAEPSPRSMPPRSTTTARSPACCQ